MITHRITYQMRPLKKSGQLPEFIGLVHKDKLIFQPHSFFVVYS